jgi:hypothetical protein
MAGNLENFYELNKAKGDEVQAHPPQNACTTEQPINL